MEIPRAEFVIAARGDGQRRVRSLPARAAFYMAARNESNCQMNRMRAKHAVDVFVKPDAQSKARLLWHGKKTKNEVQGLV